MKFIEAYEEMRLGKQVMREVWNHPDHGGKFCMIVKKSPLILHFLFVPNLTCGNWMGTIEDINATDWVVVEKLGDEVLYPDSENIVCEDLPDDAVVM